MRMLLSVEVPVKTVSEMNNRDCWQKRSRRSREQKVKTKAVVESALRKVRVGGDRFMVKLTRVGQRRLDGDNCQSSLKYCRDAVAECLRIDDGDERITWEYGQEKAKKAGVYSVIVEVWE